MVEKIRLIHFGIFCKVQQIVNIGIAVCESREEESVLRCTDHPVLHAVFNRVVGNIVEESRFVKLYRTDATEDKFINVIRGIIHIQVIRSTSRNIVCAVDQNNIVVFRIEIICHDFFIKRIDQRIVF